MEDEKQDLNQPQPFPQKWPQAGPLLIAPWEFPPRPVPAPPENAPRRLGPGFGVHVARASPVLSSPPPKSWVSPAGSGRAHGGLPGLRGEGLPWIRVQADTPASTRSLRPRPQSRAKGRKRRIRGPGSACEAALCPPAAVWPRALLPCALSSARLLGTTGTMTIHTCWGCCERPGGGESAFIHCSASN